MYLGKEFRGRYQFVLHLELTHDLDRVLENAQILILQQLILKFSDMFQTQYY